MDVRRARVVAVLATLLVVVPAGAAQAAGTGQITSPAAGATLTSSVGLQVQVSGRAGSFLEPRDHTVRLRLAGPSGSEAWSGTAPVAATCERNCGDSSTWTAGSFDPATLAPFAGTSSCNGGYTLQVQVDNGAWTGHGVRIARAPSAPGDVAVAGGVEQATVSWSAAGHPDVAGYRVQRRAGGGWTTVAEVGPDARSVTDDDVTAGEVEYRVTTLRGDGLVGGAPAAPCADTAPDLATASAPVGTTVRTTAAAPSAPSRPTPTPSASDGDGDGDRAGGRGSGAGGGDGNGATGGGTATDDGSTDGEGADADADGDGDTQAAADGGTTATRRPGNRVAPPAAVRTTRTPSVSVPDADGPDADGPDAPQVATRGETYYGEGEEFSEEIDFGDLGAVEASGGGPTTRTRVIRVPGALQGMLGEELDPARLLAPIAAGLILLAFGLHLRRWTREGLLAD